MLAPHLIHFLPLRHFFYFYWLTRQVTIPDSLTAQCDTSTKGTSWPFVAQREAVQSVRPTCHQTRTKFTPMLLRLELWRRVTRTNATSLVVSTHPSLAFDRMTRPSVAHCEWSHANAQVSLAFDH